MLITRGGSDLGTISSNFDHPVYIFSAFLYIGAYLHLKFVALFSLLFWFEVKVMFPTRLAVNF